MRVLQTDLLSSSVCARQAVQWSNDDVLALVTQKGVLINSLIPNPENDRPELNFDQVLLAEDLPVNPHLNNSLGGISDYRFPNPEVGKPITRQVTRVKWSTDGRLAVMTDDYWLRVFQNNGNSWDVSLDVSKQLSFMNKEKKPGIGTDDSETLQALRALQAPLAIADFDWIDVDGDN